MENGDQKSEARILRGDPQGDYPDDTSDVRCPVCGEVHQCDSTYTYYCEGRSEDELQLCERCMSDFQDEYELELEPSDTLDRKTFDLLWNWAPRARAQSGPWDVNTDLFTELQLIRNLTRANNVTVHWRGDTLTISSGHVVKSFSWQQLLQYRGDALVDMILDAFKERKTT